MEILKAVTSLKSMRVFFFDIFRPFGIYFGLENAGCHFNYSRGKCPRQNMAWVIVTGKLCFLMFVKLFVMLCSCLEVCCS